MTAKLHSITARVRRVVTMTLATLLIVCALVVGIGRELVKEVERFHQPLERWLSERASLDIRFGKVRGVWTQASPELHFSHVIVRNPAMVEAHPLQIAELGVRLSLSNTLLSGAPRLKLRVSGAEVHVQKDKTGFSLLGKALQSQAQDPQKHQDPMRMLLSKPKLSLYDSRVIVDGVYERRADALVSHLKLFWNGQHAFVDGEAVLRGPDEMKVSIKSDLTVLSRKGGLIQGVSYVSLSQGQLTRWIPPAMQKSLPVALQGARGTSELWLHWFNNALLSSTLRFDLRDTQIIDEQQRPYQLDRLAGTARWQGRYSEFWQLGLRNVTLESGNAKWRPAAVQVNALHEVSTQRWNYDLSVADASFAAGLSPILGLLPADSAWREALGVMQPEGRLQNLFVKARKDNQGWAMVKAQGELRDYSHEPWQKMPGIKNIGVAFLFEQQQLLLDFNEQNVVLNYPALFRSPLELSNLQGSLGLQLDAEQIRLRSSPIVIKTPHGIAHTRMLLSLPRGEASQPGSLALQSTLRNINAQYASLYLPAAIIPEKLLAWLDGALKGGTLTRGDIVFNGTLRKPELDAARTVLLGFEVTDGELQFLPEWQEPIKKLKADVIVENGLVQAHADSGEYYGLTLGKSQVWTQREGEVPHLHVHTQGSGDAANGFRVLRETPLGKTLKEPLSDMALQGPVNVDFALDAPLVANAVLTGTTKVSLDNATLKWPAQRLDADDLKMELTYDLQKGLSSQKLNANLLGGKVTGKLYQQREGKTRLLRLDLKGSTAVNTVRDWLDMPQLALANGLLPYELSLFMRPAGAAQPSQLLVKSSLKGAAIDLPPPFGKTTDSVREFSLRHTLSGATRKHEVAYADIASVAWETQAGRWQRGGIRLGAGKPLFSPRHRWRLTGTLPSFRWEEWAPVTAKLKPAADTDGKGGISWLSAFGESHLALDQLYIGEENYGPVQLALHSDTHYVTVSAGGERVQGRLTLPHTYLDSPSQRSSETPVSLYLQKLVLAGPETDTKPETEESKAPDPLLDLLPPPATLDPRLLPSAHLRIDQLWAGTDDRGSYSMTLHPIAEGVQADSLRIRLKHVDFTGAARWEQRGAETYTYFKGKGVAENAADVLAGWGYAPSIDSKSAILDMDVHWLGAPYQFKLARTQGNLSAHLKNGHFLKVSNNAAGRVWGLLNFETWMSRLQLSFEDLRDNEMTFKEIRGRFELKNNQVHVNKLRIDSSSLKMRMDGLVDMNERQLNMQWYVTVPVTRNLMLPAAMVGGLPGAATAYVIDKVLSSQIDKLTTLTYDVKGTFDQPQATLRIPLQ